jgi:hypothetical protein
MVKNMCVMYRRQMKKTMPLKSLKGKRYCDTNMCEYSGPNIYSIVKCCIFYLHICCSYIVGDKVKGEKQKYLQLKPLKRII